MDKEDRDLDNYSRTSAIPSTNITNGRVVHDERTLGELHERITPRWGNWLSADKETKSAAIRALEQTRQRRAAVACPTKSDSEFRVANGADVDVLRAAGLLDGPRVLVLPSARQGGPVVQVGEYTVRRIGRIEVDGANRWYVPEEA